MHIKKNGKLPYGETITNVVKKYKNKNWLGIVAACVSLEIIEKITDELKSLDIPFGFKANLWAVEEPLPAHRFNNAGYDEIGKYPTDLPSQKVQLEVSQRLQWGPGLLRLLLRLVDTFGYKGIPCFATGVPLRDSKRVSIVLQKSNHPNLIRAFVYYVIRKPYIILYVKWTLPSGKINSQVIFA